MSWETENYAVNGMVTGGQNIAYECDNMSMRGMKMPDARTWKSG